MLFCIDSINGFNLKSLDILLSDFDFKVGVNYQLRISGDCGGITMHSRFCLLTNISKDSFSRFLYTRMRSSFVKFDSLHIGDFNKSVDYFIVQLYIDKIVYTDCDLISSNAIQADNGLILFKDV